MADTTARGSNDSLIEAIERDLNDVEQALDRLANGNYFKDEVTGAPIRPEILTANPLARRNK
ncbi:MAG: hypothetical protein FJW19_06360 [Actinobacteria bacterium]|nr:hypothetical protein [Actinomycetota bacterium]